MKALIRKELREQFGVAVIGFLLLTLVLGIIFLNSLQEFKEMLRIVGTTHNRSLQPLLSGVLYASVSFFCAIFGSVLGWRQIRAEKHPDLWAFLVHRPVTRQSILRNKIFAGLLLYSLGAGVPLLGSILVAAYPGHVAAPFEWAMVLPVFTIFLMGIVYYLGGLLTGIRKARWFGSKGFGLGLAVAANLLILGASEFWQALLVIFVAGTITLWEAFGCFKTGGFFRGQTLWEQLALGLASTVSILLISSVIILGALTLAMAAGRGSTFSAYYRLTNEGDVFKVIQRGSNPPEVLDLNGKPFTAYLDPRTGKKFKATEFAQAMASGISVFVNFNGKTRSSMGNFEPKYYDSERFFDGFRDLGENFWYWQRDGALVAFSKITRKKVTTLLPTEARENNSDGQFGFMRPKEGAIWVGSKAPVEILVTSKSVCRVDLENRKVSRLFSVTDGDSIGAFSRQIASPAPPFAYDNFILVSRSSILLMDSEGDLKMRIPYIPPFPEYHSITLFPLQGKATYALKFDPDYVLNQKKGGNLLSRIEWVNGEGTITKEVDLPKLPKMPEMEQGLPAQKVLSVFMAPAFPIYFWTASQRFWNWFRLGPALGCALIGWVIGRKNNFSQGSQAGWGLFHLLFGVPGLLAFIAVQEWPAKEPCPSCKKPRVIDRENCEHCGASFPSPEMTGIEIFEPVMENRGG